MKKGKSQVFARLISLKLNKNELNKVSGGKKDINEESRIEIYNEDDKYKFACYDTYIGMGLNEPDCTIE